MTETQNFETREEANAFLDSLGGYIDPPAVAPLKGDAAHEVAVGPVHAGVIEPGHFRFQCMGEDVYNLQIFLGYQHRGVEEAIVKADGNLARQVALAETCAGDSSIAAATAFAEIIEAREGQGRGRGRGQGRGQGQERGQGQGRGQGQEMMVKIPLSTSTSSLHLNRDVRLRELLLEFERIANHVGDLGALAGDVAFLPTASFCGRIRGEYLNMTALICGNRFGRNAVVPGGMRCTLTEEKRAKLLDWIRTVKKDLDGALKLMFESPSVCDRLDGTGVVPKDVAERLNLVGVARRASEDFKGDVLSRALVRRLEIEESHEKVAGLLFEQTDSWTRLSQSRQDKGGSPHADSNVANLSAPRSVGRASSPCVMEDAAFHLPGRGRPGHVQAIVSTISAWRGPLVHAALFDADGAMLRYKIVDPSAHNWQGLAYALRGEQISNFPICNKSFNLSYCGTDR